MIKISNPDLLINSISELLNENLSLINQHRENNQIFYKKFFIPKKCGGIRKIDAPVQKNLITLLKKINSCFAKSCSFPECVNGFTKGRSIINNATIHLNSELIVNIDINNFFNSIKRDNIINSLRLHPFNFPKELTELLVDVATKSGYLPQGSPLSPMLSNIVANNLNRSLSEFCIRKNIRYSRYADDITFSITEGRIEDEEIIKIRQEIEQNGFKINEKKFSIKRKSRSLIVTGIKVNSKLNIKRTYIKNIKATLHNWEMVGLKEARINVDSLRGKIEFIGMVRGKNDHIYNKFLTKFNDLNHEDEINLSKSKINDTTTLPDELDKLLYGESTELSVDDFEKLPNSDLTNFSDEDFDKLFE